MNRKFFQLRQMTKNLDDTFQDDIDTYQRLLENKYQPNLDKLENDKQVIKQWDIYKINQLQQIIETTLQSECFKICICDFQKKKKISIEFWFKVAYDIFHHETKGKEVRMRFWKQMRKRSPFLEQDFKKRQWPSTWKYLEYEPCLNLEILKLYEQYLPIRPFIAETLNTKTKIVCDIRRMPMLKEEKSITFDMSKNTWFPKIEMCGPQILQQLTNSDNYFCSSIIKFTIEMKKIMFPILDLFGMDKRKGRVVNIFGEQSDFLLETIYSLKAFCGQSINYTQGSLRKRKDYKCQNSYKINEVTCSVMLSSLQENDMCEEILSDIQNNILGGYAAFAQQSSNFMHSEKNQRLILIFSQQKLQFNRLKKEVQYYQIPDYQILQLKNCVDYDFLIYYSNILFNKCMIVQQNCSSRKPFYQLMICMWTYVLAVYLTGETPNFEGNNTLQQLKSTQIDDIEIFLDLSSQDIFNIGSTDDSDFQLKLLTNQKQKKKVKFNDDNDYLTLKNKEKKKKIILL